MKKFLGIVFAALLLFASFTAPLSVHADEVRCREVLVHQIQLSSPDEHGHSYMWIIDYYDVRCGGPDEVWEFTGDGS